MNTTTENAIITIYHNVAGLIGAIGGWDVSLSNDDIGPYLHIVSSPASKCYRGISLVASSEGADLAEHVWHFWNSCGAWYESDLTGEAGEEEILHFLKDCLFEEAIFTEERSALLRASD